MIRGVLVFAGMLAACPASSAPPATPSASAGSVTPAAPRFVTADELLQRAPNEGSIWIRLSVFRAHPLGTRVEPFVLAWLGWGATIAAISPHPVAELDWMAFVGPDDPARQRLLARTSIADDVIDARLAARSDSTLRIVVRPQTHLVAGLPPDVAPGVLKIVPGARVADPAAEPDEALHVDVSNPHGLMPRVPTAVRRALIRVFSRPGTAAEGFADLTCDDEASAAEVADELRARAAKMNSFLVSLVTRDLLSGLAVTTSGSVVSLRIPANAEQLAALATLAAGFLPAAGGGK